MKKLIALILTATMLTAVPVHADRIDDQIDKLKKQIEILQAQLDKLEKQKAEEEGTTPPEEQEDDIYSITYEGNTFTYLRTDVITERAKLFAVIYFSYTNNTGSEEAPAWNIEEKVFQNGAELQIGYLYDTDIPEHERLYMEVMDGTTVTIASVYELTDMSDITVKLEPLFAFDNKDVCRFTVNLIQQ